MTEGRIVLVAVEDDPDFQLLIRATLSADPRLEISGEMPDNIERAVEMAREVAPGLIILDHNLEGEMVGLGAAPKLKEAAPGAKILLFTSYDVAAEASREPALDAYLRKDEIEKLLPTALDLIGLARS